MNVPTRLSCKFSYIMQHLKPSYYLFIDLEPSKTCKIFMHINCYENKKNIVCNTYKDEMKPNPWQHNSSLVGLAWLGKG